MINWSPRENQSEVYLHTPKSFSALYWPNASARTPQWNNKTAFVYLLTLLGYEKSLVTRSNNGCHQLCYSPASVYQMVLINGTGQPLFHSASTFDMFIDPINMHLFAAYLWSRRSQALNPLILGAGNHSQLFVDEQIKVSLHWPKLSLDSGGFSGVPVDMRMNLYLRKMTEDKAWPLQRSTKALVWSALIILWSVALLGVFDSLHTSPARPWHSTAIQSWVGRGGTSKEFWLRSSFICSTSPSMEPYRLLAQSTDCITL